MSLRSEAPLVKICGLSTPDTLEAAITAGADQIGLVFFPKSPRHVSLEQARALADQARGRAAIVGLTVDATDGAIDAIMEAVRPDWLQLHGSETPERVAAVKQRAGVFVMKAVGLATAADLAAAEPYAQVTDRILFDAKPPKDAALPGGNGVAFDWTILKPIDEPFMLSGGLSPDNVAEAVRISGAAAVDVSSGVETEPGRKDAALIAAFVHAARCR
ncbi:phosphoribosylanthranilate isomerase [Lichenifustis flavocetrariae]|uniref:N-(5'-phosphoribosyl)anthranilate isomerase n=1 Tax=Lichenifustis flavocetrariae TaxID=2949735 RepID=A0AA42CJD8_9HYPH|nr:phosphoribosylanthranilate isomerase [Lichenifustis flavocetrariae]MCW6507966.1 phosphoribosylanthranilate isomerase [Lichenifustis flavocetrariae]